jgi:hypothetical protein
MDSSASCCAGFAKLCPVVGVGSAFAFRAPLWSSLTHTTHTHTHTHTGPAPGPAPAPLDRTIRYEGETIAEFALADVKKAGCTAVMYNSRGGISVILREAIAGSGQVRAKLCVCPTEG